MIDISASTWTPPPFLSYLSKTHLSAAAEQLGAAFTAMTGSQKTADGE